MLRELTGADWRRLLAIPDDRTPDVAILRGTRNLKHWYTTYVERLDDVVHVGSPNGLLDDVLLGRHGSVDLAYASVYGPAMASELAHVFCLLGVRAVLQTGCCGAWAEGMRAGDLFLATHAGCGDGASRFYTPDRDTVPAGVDIQPHLPEERPQGIAVHTGGIFTTSALFAEGHAEVQGWADAGWVAVDMETATTFSVATHFGVPAASLLYVFDNPLTEGDIVLSNDQKNERRALGNTAMVDATFHVARHLARTP